MGLAGNSSVSLNQGFAGNILNHAPDLVILENAILNDSKSSTLAGAYTNISQLYDKFDINNLLVISIATHRFLIGLETIQYDRSNIIRSVRRRRYEHYRRETLLPRLRKTCKNAI